MNKFSYASLSLIAALPGGVLAYLLAMNFVNRFEVLTLKLQILSGLTLLVSALLAVMPIGIVIFAAKPESAEKTEESEGEEGTEPPPLVEGEPDMMMAEDDSVEPVDDSGVAIEVADDQPDLGDFEVEQSGPDSDLFVEGDEFDYEDFTDESRPS